MIPTHSHAEVRVQPHNIEAEQALLGALLLTNEIADRLTDLKKHHFYDPVHGRVYEIAMDLIRKNELASAITLRPLLANDSGLTELGGTDYLARCCGAAISIVAAKDYARQIRDLYARRVIIDAADYAQSQAARSGFEDALDNTTDILDRLDGTLLELRGDVSEKPLSYEFTHIGESAAERVNENFQRGSIGLSTGLKVLDDQIGGLAPGRMYLLGARTSMGKTALGLDIAANVVSQGQAALICSLEMSGEQIANRMYSRALAANGYRLPYAAVDNANISEAAFQRYLECGRDMTRTAMPFAPGKSLSEIRAAISQNLRMRRNSDAPLGFVLVDYLQNIKIPSLARHGKSAVVAESARALQELALEFDLPIMVLSQIKREVEDRKNKRPELSDIRWAGEAEEAADAVIFLYRHAYYLAKDVEAEEDSTKKVELMADLEGCKNMAEVIVAKNRHGQVGTKHIYCDLATNRFSDNPIGQGEHNPDDFQ